MPTDPKSTGSMPTGSKPTISVFLLAGEASGDKIGADLIAKLEQSVNLDISGVGGRHMNEQGLTSLFPITDLSVMGIVDVAWRLPLLLRRVNQCIDYILQNKPQIVVLIDSQVFSNLISKKLRKRGFNSPIILYVSPTFWAHKPQRASKIKPLYDEVLSILPFEPELMKKLNGPECTYVGHPALKSWSNNYNYQPSSNMIALMPGSRDGELRRHLPMFGQAVKHLQAANPRLKFSIITLPHLAKKISKLTINWASEPKIIVETEQRNELLRNSRLAICVAGTATLELAMAKVPMVVCYVMDSVQRVVNRRLKVKRFSLPNLVLQQDLVPELLMERPNADLLSKTALDLLTIPAKIDAQLDGFSSVYEKMHSGTEQFPRTDPAKIVLSHLP